MILYIVRHGESQRNVQPVGPHDCDLTPQGERQAERTAQWLQGKGIHTLYTSPAIRTLMTASRIGQALGLRPKAWVPLVEWGYLFDEPGLTGREIRARFPDVELDNTFEDEQGWARHISKESWDELLARAQRVVQELQRRHPVGSGAVAVVTHAHLAGYLVGALLGIHRADGWDGVIHHDNCGVSCFEFHESLVVQHYVNARAHLAGFIRADV